jgi:4-amino-4-deoxy-L-arabinose transferase-like glycosyltransferase
MRLVGQNLKNLYSEYELRFWPWVAALGVVLIVRGQWLWFKDIEAVRPGGIPVLEGMILLLVALRLTTLVPVAKPLFDLSAGHRFPLRWKLLVTLAGISLCVYAGWRAYPERTPVWDTLLLWGLGICLTIVGLVPRHTASAWWHSLLDSVRQEWRIWLMVGALFAAGLVVRTVRLGTVPHIMAGDEAQFGFESVSLNEQLHWVYNPFQLGIWHHPRTVHTLMLVFIKLMGQTVAAVRMPWAILGALTVPAVYLMGQRLFDRRVGLIAAAVMATFPLHIQFSRTAMDMTGDALFITLTLAFLTRALHDGDELEAALAGLCLGLSQYFYFAGRIAAPLVIAYIGLYALHNRRAMWKRAGVLLITGVVAGVVVFPNLYATTMDKERSFSPRLGQVSIWSTGNLEMAARQDRLKEYWTDQIQRSFLAYVHFQDESDVYGRYNPVLGWYAGVPFMVGLGVVLRRWRDPRFLVLGLWAAGTAFLGGTLLVDPPHYPRYVNVTPGLAVIVALGVIAVGIILSDLADSLFSLLSRLVAVKGLAATPKWLLPVILGLLLALANERSYALDYLPKTPELLYGEATVELNEVADILDSFHGQYKVARFSSLRLDMEGTDLLRYRTPKNVGIEYDKSLSRWYEVLSPGQYAFVIAPERFDEVAAQLLYEFPDGQLREYTNQRTHLPLVYIYFATVPESGVSLP